jgi:hypothetical protein
MKMKTVISMLTAGICALAVQQAQANLIQIASETATLALANGNSPFTLTTTVFSGAAGGDYEYQYVLSGAVPKIGAFTVNSLGDLDSMSTAGINTFTATGSWVLADNPVADGYVTWTVSPIIAGGETYTYLSPLPPTPGNAFAQDGQQYLTTPPPGGGGPNTLVPLPDGGLTVALLGGAMTAMALIRRRMAS